MDFSRPSPSIGVMSGRVMYLPAHGLKSMVIDGLDF
jgi:hypothetical protein